MAADKCFGFVFLSSLKILASWPLLPLSSFLPSRDAERSRTLPSSKAGGFSSFYGFIWFSNPSSVSGTLPHLHIPVTRLQPPHLRSGVPMASTIAALAHAHSRHSALGTGCPRRCLSESCSASRVRRARSRRARGGACRVVASERAQLAVIGRPPRQLAQPSSMDARVRCFCGGGELNATLSFPLQYGFHPPPAGRQSSDSCA